MFIAFAKNQEELNEFEGRLQTYVNTGFVVYEIYDNLEEDFVDSVIYSGDKASTKYLNDEFMKKARELGIETDLYDVEVAY